MARYASIDIGTNTFRLLIAEVGVLPPLAPLVQVLEPFSRVVAEKSFKTLYSENQPVRLGEGFSKKKYLSPAAIERALTALKRFQGVIEKAKVDGVVVTGTSAVREAENSALFLAMVKEKTGLKIEVLSGEEEARYMLSGIHLIFPQGMEDDETMVVVDIGGGSTEFIGTRGGMPTFLFSTPLGAVTLTEKYLQSDRPTPQEVLALKKSVEGVLHEIAHHFPLRCRFIGTAGTITTLAAIEQKMTDYDPDKINGYKMTKRSIENILNRLSQTPLKKRSVLPGIEKGRGDILIAGILILLCVMDRFKYEVLYVSDYGLREGSLFERFFK